MKLHIVGILGLVLATFPCSAQDPSDVLRQLPPTIGDVVLLLKSYAPNTEKVSRLRAEFANPVPESGSPVDLARVWHQKANVAAELGETQARYDMLNKALAYARQAPRFGGQGAGVGSEMRIRQDLVSATSLSVGFGAAVDANEKLIADFGNLDVGAMLNMRAWLPSAYTALGDMDQAQRAMDTASSVLANLRNSPKSGAENYGSTWATNIESARGELQIALGKSEDAVRTLLGAERISQQMIEDSARNRSMGRFGIPQAAAEAARDSVRIKLARAYIEQQRFNEAELELREVLKNVLARVGRNSAQTGGVLSLLSRVYAERGRTSEALALAQWADRVMYEAGISAGSLQRINIRRGMADLMVVLGRHPEAVAIFDELQKAAAGDTHNGKQIAVATLGMIKAFSSSGRAAEGLASGDKLLAASIRNYGATHYRTAEVRGYRAMALQQIGRSVEARKDFEDAIAVLLEPAKALGGNERSAIRSLRLRVILESYLQLLVAPTELRTQRDTAEAFRVADVVRWQSVQKAVSSSALRAAAGTPELGTKIKAMQDNEDELQAVYKNLIAQRSAPPEKQLPAVILAMERRISTLQSELENSLSSIRREFPKYDALVNPRPADLQTARHALRPNEALISIYVSDAGCYVWATGSAPDAPLQFHYSPRSRSWIAEQVKRLRDGVELSAGITPTNMKFDMEAALAIYRELLAPVDVAWAKADTLLVVANEALGQIPFSMLTTGPAAGSATAAALPLSQFRQAPWLARKLAISYLPSVSALVTLRAGSTSTAPRAPFIGFGDPDFGHHTAKGASASRGTRNLKISHAPKWNESKPHDPDSVPAAAENWAAVPELSPLPDTRDEIVAIAKALSADPEKDAFFGLQANPRRVIDSNMKGRRIVAFATHGLVAGDLPALDQPALALSALPGKDIYSGLLKLDDVLKLTLDADLVVLSACNTAAADGSGSEAVSGLGRGFFHAGSRSILATHWPVDSVSARLLVTHLFERYSQDDATTRAKALQRAMLQVLDAEVATDGRGAPEYAYAHPAFWAPYALYGDPGR